MSTAAKLAANQANAQHSTGPKTETGKATSAQNATRHGLSSKQVVLPGEDAAEFEALKASFYREYAPKTDLENALVGEFVACNWRLDRARRVETAFLAKITEGSPDPAIAIAVAFLEKPAELQRITRYITSIERAYWRAMNTLHKILKARQQAEYRQEIQEAARVVIRKRAASSLGSFCNTAETPATEPTETQSAEPQLLHKRAAA